MSNIVFKFQTIQNHGGGGIGEGVWDTECKLFSVILFFFATIYLFIIIKYKFNNISQIKISTIQTCVVLNFAVFTSTI